MGSHTMRSLWHVLAVAAVLGLAFSPASGPGASPDGPNQPSNINDCKKSGWRNYPHAWFRNQGDCIRFVITGVFACRDPLGCVTYKPGEPIRIATALALTGAEPLGLDTQRGVEIALNERGDVFGHGLELKPGDDACSAEGGEAVANLIVSDPAVAAVVGTSCSSAARVAAPILSDAGYSIVSPSNTGPDLTAPATHSPGYMRVSWTDRDAAVAMAEFLNALGAQTSAIVVDGSLYSSALGDAFLEVFGGSNLAYLLAASDGSDAGDVIAAIVEAGVPDVLFMPVFEDAGADLVMAARHAPEIDQTVLAATDALGSQGFVNSVAPDAEGMFFTAPDMSFTGSDEYQEFLEAYFELTDGEQPLTWFAPFGFDAAMVILRAIEAVGIVDGQDDMHAGRKALRDALFATSGFEGLTGTISCSPLGDCGAVGMAILTVTEGEIGPVP